MIVISYHLVSNMYISKQGLQQTLYFSKYFWFFVRLDFWCWLFIVQILVLS
jgi:hypothetical protein